MVAGISLVALVTLLLGWYGISVRRKQRKAREILRWIQSAMAGRGQVTGISWITSSKFRVPLRLACGIFQRAWVMVELLPQQTPMQWLFNKIRNRHEVLVFEADLDFPPTFSLHVHNFRWVARSSRRSPVNHPGWKFECLQPMIISTRADNQKEIACAMASLTRTDGSEFVDVSFQRNSPHFSATLRLESLSPGSPSRVYILDAMRELAGSVSASLF